MKNTVTLIGNLGANPEIQTTQNGNKVARINVCTTESFKKDDGTWQNENTWHQVILWNKLADVQMQKGNEVFIEGKISYRDYTVKEGIKRYSTEIIARIVKVFVRRENANNAPMPEAPDHPFN